VLLAMGDRRGALAAFEAEPSATWRHLGMPLGLHAVGQTEAAQKALTELLANASGSEYQVAEVYAYLADASSCFKWLERARVLHDPGVMLVRSDPLFKPLARDPRYLAFLSSVGLKPL
jgi:hypothetical protein